MYILSQNKKRLCVGRDRSQSPRAPSSIPWLVGILGYSHLLSSERWLTDISARLWADSTESPLFWKMNLHIGIRAQRDSWIFISWCQWPAYWKHCPSKHHQTVENIKSMNLYQGHIHSRRCWGPHPQHASVGAVAEMPGRDGVQRLWKDGYSCVPGNSKGLKRMGHKAEARGSAMKVVLSSLAGD